MKNLIFLGIATAVVIFSVIVLNVGPNIKGYSGNDYDESCSHYKDKYELGKDLTYSNIIGYFGVSITNDERDDWLDLQKEAKNRCYRHKAMIGLEYATFNINVVFGFICAILGLLKYSGNNLGKIVGILGLVTGVIGFVLTLVYVIYSGIIFNNEVVGKSFDEPSSAYDGAYIRTKPDGAFMKWDDSKKNYVCIFYDKENKDSLFARYSDYGKKVYNYYKGIEYPVLSKEYKYQRNVGTSSRAGCVTITLDSANVLWDNCKRQDENSASISKFKIKDENGNDEGECDKLYAAGTSSSSSFSSYANKNKYDNWVTSIVFSCLIIACHIGLAIFGFLLFKESNSL